MCAFNPEISNSRTTGHLVFTIPSQKPVSNRSISSATTPIRPSSPRHIKTRESTSLSFPRRADVYDPDRVEADRT